MIVILKWLLNLRVANLFQ